MVSFSVYPSWHLMRQAALDPAKSAKCRKARLIIWMTRGPRKTCNDWSIGHTPTKWPEKLTGSLQGDGKKRYTANRGFFVRSPARRIFILKFRGVGGRVSATDSRGAKRSRSRCQFPRGAKRASRSGPRPYHPHKSTLSTTFKLTTWARTTARSPAR